MTLLSLRTGRLASISRPRPAARSRASRSTVLDVLRPMAPEAIASGKGNNARPFRWCRSPTASATAAWSSRARSSPLDAQLAGRAPSHAWRRLGACLAGGAPRRAFGRDRLRPRRREAAGRSAIGHGSPIGWTTIGCTMRMALENLEDRPVPAGIGLHPFFVRDADTELTCRTEAVWPADAEVLADERIAVPPDWDFQPAQGRRRRARQLLRRLGRAGDDHLADAACGST